VHDSLSDLLRSYSEGRLTLEEAVSQIKLLGCRAVGEMAKLDTGRGERTGIPEAILAEGKTAEDLTRIALAHLEETGCVIVTRISPEQLSALQQLDLSAAASLEHNSRARTAVLRRGPKRVIGGKVGILAAGTADIPAAEEARVVAEEMGCQVVSEYDVGVAGIHRLFPSLERLQDADALVVAAGREGTLPAVVAGLADAPVIGLPISTGYGLGGDGVAALLSMLQSCSVITVVNIDAGFVAGAYAARIALRRKRV
jgi:NCAIR mutase (PurE)-related protein